MPHPRRSLTIGQARDVAAACFTGYADDLVGVEVEWPLHQADHPSQRPSMSQLAPVLTRALPRGGMLSVEPGGQIELSTDALSTAAAVIDALDADAQVLHARLRAQGLCPLDLAVDDRRAPERILDRPRYAAMEAFFAHHGDAGTWMMANTASVQINISHDPGGSQQRWELANRIGPLLIAAFANSPGIGRDGRRWQSVRQEIWSRIDAGRTAPVPLTPRPDVGWANYALAADVFYINTGGQGVALGPGLTFGDWIANGHPIGWPTSTDLRYHLTTLFPPIRPRGWLELRMLDALPTAARTAAVHTVCAAMAPAVCAELLARLPDTRTLWSTAAREGLAHPLLRSASQTLISTAQDFLQSTGQRAGAATVDAFAERYTRRGFAPAHDREDCRTDTSDPAQLAATI